VVAGRYRALRVIGKSTVGVVYEVEQQSPLRKLTLERFALPVEDEPQAHLSFRHDADVVARLKHPNVADIISWETLEDGSRCVVLERLPGEDLATRMKKTGALPWGEVASIAEQMLAALDAAHGAGVVHGDLGPQHVFLVKDKGGKERCKVHGFGVSKIRHLYPHPGGEDPIEAALYLSPEHAQGNTTGILPASDCFSFGSILYELCTGLPAFNAKNAGGVIYKICHGSAEPLLQNRKDAPPELAKILARVWDRDPAKRIASAAALREELAAALAGAVFLSGGAPEAAAAGEPMSAPVMVLTPEPLSPSSVPTKLTPLPEGGRFELNALKQQKWFWPAVGGAGASLLLLIILIARGCGGSSPAAPVAVQPPSAAPPAAEPAKPEPAPAAAPAFEPDAVEAPPPEKRRRHHHHHKSSSSSHHHSTKKKRR
jgi:serine/threonine-protein kinase